MSSDLFTWPDYFVFTGMLVISMCIGLYHGCSKTGIKSTSEFLLGGKNLAVLPVAASLVASFKSSISLLGQPSEIYNYGTIYVMTGTSYVFFLSAAAFVYLPVYYNLQLTSVYEYLELRFSRQVRQVASIIYILQMTTYMSMVVYAPSLALSQVTGLNLYGSVTAIFFFCTFYTTIGGLKAVVWTDTLQAFIMYISMIVIIAKGVWDVGGVANVWSIAERGQRLEFLNFDLDPRVRHTNWGLFFGSFFLWLNTYGCNQAQVQRYLSVSTIKKAQWALFINFFGLLGMLILCCFAGLVVYAKYETCDPIAASRVTKADQIFPLFVMDTVGSIPGLPGLFVAGIFSGTLSTVSTGLNSLAAITLEDFVRGNVKDLSDQRATSISKCLAVIYGLASFALVFIAEQLGAILQAQIKLAGVLGGPLLGLFSLGMFVPWVHKRGALIGLITGLVVMTWLGIGANMAKDRKQIVYEKLPLSTTGCVSDTLNNSTADGLTGIESGGIIEFYRVSYIWYSAISFVVTFAAGVLSSLLLGPEKLQRVDKRLISPAVDTMVNYLLTEKARTLIGWSKLGSSSRPKDSSENRQFPLESM